MGNTIRQWVRLGVALGVAGALTVPSAGVASGQSSQDVTNLQDTTPEALVAQLLGDDTPVSNVSYTGSPLAAGAFSGFEDLGIDSGVYLATGDGAGVEGDSSLYGPNQWSNATTDLGEPGDSDLDALVAPDTTNDAAVLEFDFVPDATSVTFSYVFGSEEYEEYVDAGVNDVFAFYVNGTNYATVDGSDGQDIFVSIDTINHQVNTQYYRSNTEGQYNTELDGFTVVLGFEAPVNQGETNHIKLAIADTGDSILDSAVLLLAGSFRGNTPPVAANQTVSTPSGVPVEIVLEGTDPDGDDLSFEIITPPDPAHGSLSDVSGSLVGFTPAEGFEGTTTFTYRVSDGSAYSSTATVTVVVSEWETIIPEAPVQTGNTVQIPDQDGVVYLDPEGNELTGVVDVPEGGLRVIAEPLPGYYFADNATVSWDFEFVAGTDPTASPSPTAKPTHTPKPGLPKTGR